MGVRGGPASEFPGPSVAAAGVTTVHFGAVGASERGHPAVAYAGRSERRCPGSTAEHACRRGPVRRRPVAETEHLAGLRAQEHDLGIGRVIAGQGAERDLVAVASRADAHRCRPGSDCRAPRSAPGSHPRRHRRAGRRQRCRRSAGPGLPATGRSGRRQRSVGPTAAQSSAVRPSPATPATSLSGARVSPVRVRGAVAIPAMLVEVSGAEQVDADRCWGPGEHAATLTARVQAPATGRLRTFETS